jgi:hypothetical protein
MPTIARGLVFGLLCLLAAPGVSAADRFGRKVVEVQNKKDYQFYRLDDVDFPFLENERYSVSCIVYRGSVHYYVEVAIQNKTSQPVALGPDFVNFNKPGYTAFRTSTIGVAEEIASAANIKFVPTPPPNMGETTTLNATATTNGNRTEITGTATTGPSAAQSGANLGNAIGNVIAARRVASAKSNESRFLNYLTTFAHEYQPGPLAPGEARIVIVTFDQVKQKKAPFDLTVRIGEDSFVFKMKE